MELSLDSSVTLLGGIKMPVLGLGTAGASGRVGVAAVLEALNSGYRLIDTASRYGNEREVGLAVRKSNVPREDVFITTKVAGSEQGYASTLKACEGSLRRLGLDHIDLYLIHWPGSRKRLETWRAMEKLLEVGKARAIGVSNFMNHHVEELRAASPGLPVVNQIELSPFLQQRDVVAYCRGMGILVEAYSPLTRGRRLDNPTVERIATQHQRTPAQVLLRWSLQHGFVAIPKSVRSRRIRENANVFDFTLGQEDMGALDRLDQGMHFDWDPTNVP